tara:strand:- start:919 stop:1773 length:855 start_codon:yes stop_codon:yes gene_type:complete
VKYSYFSAGKAGKLLIRNQFWFNNKTHVFFTTGEPPYFAVITTPEGRCDWYWENGLGELSQFHHHEYNDMINKIYYNEMWFPVGGSIKDWLRRDDISASSSCPGQFHLCFSEAFRQDMITNPLVMLGYGGVLGSKKLMKSITSRTPTLENIPLDYVVEELQKRKNIIAYKTNIRHMAHNFFIGSGRPFYKHPDVLLTQTDEGYIKECTKRVNTNREFPKVVSKLLDHYNIPYEWFDLDEGNYAEAFDLQRELPRDVDPTPELDEYVTDKEIVEGWIDDYMKLYP